MNLSKDDKHLLERLRPNTEDGFHPDAYVSWWGYRHEVPERLKFFESQELVQTNGIGYRLTFKGKRALRWGKWKYIAPNPYHPWAKLGKGGRDNGAG